MKKALAGNPYLKLLWDCLLAASAANVLCEGTTRWSYYILAPAMFYLICRIRTHARKQQAGAMWAQGSVLLVISAAFGVLTILGKAYNTGDNWAVLYRNKVEILYTLVRILGMTVLAYYTVQAVCLLYLKNSLRAGSGKGHFLLWWMLFLLVWLPFLVINYPGHIMGDTCSQIPMAFNMPNKFSTSVVRLSEDVMLTNHHPVLHTLMLGGAIRLGRMLFSSDSAGLFIYTLFQYLIITCIYGYALSWLERQGAPAVVTGILALIWLLVPNFSEYAILATKDGLFSAFLLFFGIQTAQLLTKPEGAFAKQDALLLMVSAVCCMLMRNNGFYVVILSMPFLAAALKSARRRLILMTILLLLMHVGYNRVLLPALKITPGNARELLSVPLQQTARFFISYPDEVTQEQKEIFDRIIHVDKLEKKYTPVMADPVKALYRKKTVTGKDLLDFFKMWASIFLHHPGCCLQASLCSLNGYYSYQETAAWNYKYASSSWQVKRLKEESGFDIQYPDRFSYWRDWIGEKTVQFQDNPIIFLLMQAAFYNWILVFILWFALLRKKIRVLALFLPPAAALLTALAGPMNARTYFRYEYPVTVILPFLVMVLLCCANRLRSGVQTKLEDNTGRIR